MIGKIQQNFFKVGGIDLFIWVQWFLACYHFGETLNRHSYPDGQCYLKQSNILIEVFSILETAIKKQIEKKRNGRSKNRT